MRLDQYLVEKGYSATRSKASQLIRKGSVLLNSKVITNKGYSVKENDVIEVKEKEKYVSRGGYKLEKAIEEFHLDFQGKVIVDIGSSTGGFTDCAMKYGARKVYSIDVGTSQLSPLLKEDKRVKVLENTNFKDVKETLFDEKIDYFLCDVSFLSSREIINTLLTFSFPFSLVLLFKPEFEGSREDINEEGRVKDRKHLQRIVEDYISFLKEKHLSLTHSTYSPIKGNKSGNIEFLFLIEKKDTPFLFDSTDLIEEAFNSAK